MKPNLWIARSQRFYRWLLRLYPQAHREIYEAEMFRVFTSQCQDAYRQRGTAGILSLWLRTLFDLGITVVHEHLIDPHARLGLLEANPNAPLPWKGVLLVLIPPGAGLLHQSDRATYIHNSGLVLSRLLPGSVLFNRACTARLVGHASLSCLGFDANWSAFCHPVELQSARAID
jgi:hypothetical protein